MVWMMKRQVVTNLPEKSKIYYKNVGSIFKMMRVPTMLIPGAR
jgi:hypothetical protein